MSRISAALRFPFARVLFIVMVGGLLPACVTVNMQGGDAIESLSRAQKEMRATAAALSETVWESMTSRSLLNSMTTMLLIGRDEEKGPGLVASPVVTRDNAALAYVAQKETEFSTADAQLTAMVADVRRKTWEARALVAATELVIIDHVTATGPNRQFDASGKTSSDIVQGLVAVREDRRVLDDSIVSAKRQQATFELAERAYRDKNPDMDTTLLSTEIELFDYQIERMVVLANSLSGVKTPSQATS